jgi:competence protein ComEC
MWRLWPASGARAREPVGTELITLSIAAVAAVAAGNFWPPGPGWAWPLLLLAATALACALSGGSRLVWACAGLALGLGACALAPRAPAAGEGVPVRFVADIRDGWRAGRVGWGTRVAVVELDRAGLALGHARELDLQLGGAATAELLPAPGARIAGAGELVSDQGSPLQPPLLRVKTMLLVRPAGQGRLVDRLREAGAQALRRAAGASAARQDAAGLAAALLLGRREELPRDEVASFKRSGLAHLLAVAGLHVGAVGLIVWWGLALAGVQPGPRRWVLIVALLGFCLLAGGNVPVRRATTAAVAYLLARKLGRPLEPLPAVWAIVAGLAIWEPAAVLQPAFQLSAAVTLALVRWAGPLGKRLVPLPRWLAPPVAVAVVGQAASIPLTGQYFLSVPWLGMAANLIAVPLALPLVLTGGVALAASFVSAGAASWVLTAMAGEQWLLDRIADAGGVLTWVFPVLPALLAVGLAVLAVVALTRWRLAWLAAWATLAVSVGWMLLPGRAPAGAELRLLRVREGMALLLRCRSQSVLVDTGSGATDAWRDLGRLRVRRLDALVLTHPDVDHIGGAAAVLDHFRVGSLVVARAQVNRPELAPLLDLASRRGVPVLLAEAGQSLLLGGWEASVLWPGGNATALDNDASLVLAMRAEGRTALVTGDIEAPGEGGVLARRTVGRVDVLQLAHHGSRTSSTAAFLAAADPLVAVAATGLRPRFAYPHPEVRARLRSRPNVLVEQLAGVERVWWSAGGPLWVGTATPVAVPARILALPTR